MDIGRSTAERKFSQVVEAISRLPGTEVGGGKGFGSGALKVKGKIFAMISSRDQVVVKLPTARVDELVASGKGKRFEPRPGRMMKEWVILPEDGANWVELVKEACAFVRRAKS
jgi:hypothetical protein